MFSFFKFKYFTYIFIFLVILKLLKYIFLKERRGIFARSNNALQDLPKDERDKIQKDKEKVEFLTEEFKSSLKTNEKELDEINDKTKTLISYMYATLAGALYASVYYLGILERFRIFGLVMAFISYNFTLISTLFYSFVNKDIKHEKSISIFLANGDNALSALFKDTISDIKCIKIDNLTRSFHENEKTIERKQKRLTLFSNCFLYGFFSFIVCALIINIKNSEFSLLEVFWLYLICSVVMPLFIIPLVKGIYIKILERTSPIETPKRLLRNINGYLEIYNRRIDNLTSYFRNSPNYFSEEQINKRSYYVVTKECEVFQCNAKEMEYDKKNIIKQKDILIKYIKSVEEESRELELLREKQKLTINETEILIECNKHYSLLESKIKEFDKLIDYYDNHIELFHGIIFELLYYLGTKSEELKGNGEEINKKYKEYIKWHRKHLPSLLKHLDKQIEELGNGEEVNEKYREYIKLSGKYLPALLKHLDKKIEELKGKLEESNKKYKEGIKELYEYISQLPEYLNEKGKEFDEFVNKYKEHIKEIYKYIPKLENLREKSEEQEGNEEESNKK